MNDIRLPTVPLLALLALLWGCTGGNGADASRVDRDASADQAQLADLRDRVAELERRRDRLADAAAVQRLQRTWGYYMDAGMWQEAAGLFADDATLEFGLDGVYVGRERIAEYLRRLGGGHDGLAPGRLSERLQLMPVVTVAEDGHSAQARWRALWMKGEHGGEAYWGEGPYENEYVRQDGVWRISRLHWFQSFVVPYDGGWGRNEDANGARYVADDFPPDRPSSVDYPTWPATFLPPFHFDNPVTGE